MEASSGVVLKSSFPNCYSSAGKPSTSSICPVSRVTFRRGNRFPVKIGNINNNGGGGFKEKGHLEYYMMTPVCGERKGKGKGNKGWNGMATKKRMKLLKGLSKDLSTFSDLGFGLELDSDQGLFGQDNSITISQAAEVLLTQLKQLKAEEEKQKKQEKQHKQQKPKTQDCESSSSSSSESSDSECDEEVVDMSQLKPIETEEQPPLTTSISPDAELEQQEWSNMILESTLNKDVVGIEVLSMEASNEPESKRRVEVCMGGKCKKMGGPALMEEFRRAVGDEAGEVVVGCKCMGKCRSGPNVRVLSDEGTNPLCVGVGLEDVGLIVANYFGAEHKKGLGVAVAGLAS